MTDDCQDEMAYEKTLNICGLGDSTGVWGARMNYLLTYLIRRMDTARLLVKRNGGCRRSPCSLCRTQVINVHAPLVTDLLDQEAKKSARRPNSWTVIVSARRLRSIPVLLRAISNFAEGAPSRFRAFLSVFRR